MDENMIHRYISESPFFDYSTKNGLYIDQSKSNWQAYNIVGNRKLFEDEMRSRKGDEYMIVGEPQVIQSGEGAGQKNGMWVVRKQNRDRTRTVDGRMEEVLTTLGTYYLVGENMYQAPSVGDVVGNRLVAAATSLSKFFDTAVNLPTFSPTSGYSYLPHSTSKAALTSISGSASASPTRSREGSVVPGAETQSLRSGSLIPESQQKQSSSTQDSRLLARSFQTYLEFGDEYMDENPLIGEPGSFSFTHSAAAVKKRRADEEAAVAAAAKAKEQQAASRVATPATKVEQKPPSPPAVMTAEAKGGKERRGSKMEKIKRKKSRASVVPTTPGAGTGSLLPPGGSAG